MRSGSIGQAPTSVCQSSSSSCGSSSARHAARRSTHSSASAASATMRARTSPERFVSCVCVASRWFGKRASRSRFARWNSLDGEREAAGVAADLVQRGQAEVAVERGVLDALRHHGPGRLLEARHELVVAAFLQQQDAGAAAPGAAASASRSASSTLPDHGSTYVR